MRVVVGCSILLFVAAIWIIAVEDLPESRDRVVVQNDIHVTLAFLFELAEKSVPDVEEEEGEKFRPVLSTFGHAGDRLAGRRLRWPVPPLGEDGELLDVPVEEFVRRKVSARDTCVAMRYQRKYAAVRVCQAGRCAETYVCDTGPWGARCSSPDHCAPGRPCKRRMSDPTRPGNAEVWWWTIQVARDGPCVHRGVVDVPAAFCDLISCQPMRPATVRVLGRATPGARDVRPSTR